MKQKILGIEVEQEVYDKYARQVYSVPGVGEMSLTGVALYAESQEVAEKCPEAAIACKKIVSDITAELTGKAPEAVGFGVYIDDLDALYKTAAPKRLALRSAKEKADAAWKECIDTFTSEIEAAEGKAKYLRAQEEYKQSIADLYKETQASIEEIRENLAKDCADFYGVKGEQIDANVQTLLSSGITLKASEAEELFDRFTNNVTMLRILGEYCRTHNIRSDRGELLFAAAQSGGQNELEIFNRVADPILLAVGESETSVTVWQPANGLFDKYANEAKQAFADLPVKP